MSGPDIPRKPLPSLLAHYRDVASYAAAMRLAKHYGGTYVYLPLPDNLSRDHHLVQSLGFDDAVILCKELGPGQIVVPMDPEQIPPEKKEIILRLAKEQRFSGKEIARMAGTTDRHVWRILQKYPIKKNLPLFD